MGASVSTNDQLHDDPSPKMASASPPITAQALTGEVKKDNSSPKTATTRLPINAQVLVDEVKKDNSSGHPDTACKILEKNNSKKTEPVTKPKTTPPVIAVSNNVSSSSSSSNNNSNNNHNSSTSSNSKPMAMPKKTESNSNKLLPHKYEDIIRDADEIINPTELQDRLHSGIFLNKNKKKYWVDSSGRNCFMLFSRSLSITWGEDKRFWLWPSTEVESPTRDAMVVEVAELMNVCWLEVNGKLDVSYLSPGVKYEVVFVVKMKDHSYGWEVPVNLKLVLPDGTTQHQHKVNLQTKPRSQWVELHVGEFQASPASSPPQPNNKKAEIQFSMFECEGGQWKRGLVIKGVIVRPKN